MEPAQLTSVLIDFDETLVDSFPDRASAIAHVVQQHLGREVSHDEVVQATLRFSNIEDIMESLAHRVGLGPKLARAFRERYYGENGPALRLFPGMGQVLTRLRAQGVALALVTSRFRSREEAGLRWGAEMELEKLRIKALFGVVVGNEDTAEHKPHRAPFLKALERMGQQPQDALAVGDSPLDIAAARGAGIRTAAALWGALSRDALLDARPDLLLEKPVDVTRLFSQKAPT